MKTKEQKLLKYLNEQFPATVGHIPLADKIREISLNQAEGHLVKHLLELWNAVWEAGPCRHGCECARCRAMEEAGNHNAATYTSLEEKALAAMSNDQS